MASAAAASASSGGAGPAPRLMILKMQVENFKSYGGVKEIGPFHKSFSSVVGPNGSGKSNVIDAMLFVFGKKSSKLRMNKLSELIHKSAEYPDLDHARVTVFFQEIIDSRDASSASAAASGGAGGAGAGAGTPDEDAYTVVPNSHFTVSRTVHRDNSSKYYLNGKPLPMSEVTSLLKGKGIDLDNNRFLILQGEVELISQMKPKAQGPHEEGLLEYLEDIIGSNTLVDKIEASEKMLAELTEQRSHQLKRLQMVEKDKGALESAKVEAEALLAKEREILRQSSLYAQKEMSITSTQVAGAEKKAEGATAALAAHREAGAAATARVADLETRFDTANKTLESVSEEVAAAAKAFSSCEQRDTKLREDLKAAKATQRKGEETAAREGDKAAAAKKTIDSTTAALPGMEALVTRLSGEKTKEEEEYEKVMGSLKGETEGLRKQMEAKQAELQPAAEAAAEAASALQTAKTELRLLKERTEAVAREVASLRAKEEKAGADLKAKTAERAAVTAELETGTARKAKLEAELTTLTALEAEAAEKVKACRARLEESRASLAADGTRGGLLQQLMAATKRGGPLAGAGLHGRLGDLGTIDAAYDAAVTTACAGLNWLVVETTEGGQACVEFLRSRNLGRAKFIMLDKIAHMVPAMTRAFTAPEGAPRLFDLIKPSHDRYRAAFYFALRDTLVAKNLDVANKLAYGPEGPRARVVTLNGELIEMSGTMSGGGKGPRKGGMLLSGSTAAAAAAAAAGGAGSITAEEVAAIEKEHSTLSAALTEMRTKKIALQTELRDLERGLPKLQQRLSKLEMELSALAKIKEDMTAQVAAASAAAAASKGVSAEDSKALADLGAKIASLEARSAAATAASAGLEAEVSALQRRILETGGEKVARAKARLDRASEALEKAIADVTRAKSELKAAEKTAKATEKAIAEATKAATDAAAVYAKLQTEKEPLEVEALAALQRKQAAEAKLPAAKTAVEQLRQEMGGLALEVKSMKLKEAELVAAVEDVAAIVAAGKKKLDYLAKKVEKLGEEYRGAMAEYIQDLTAQMTELGDLAEDEEEGGAGASAAASSGGATESKEPEKKASARGGKKGAAAAAAAAPAPSAAAASGIPAKVLERIREPLELPLLTPEELGGLRTEALAAAIASLESERNDLMKKANLSAITEYRAKEKEFLKRVAEVEAVSRAREDARKAYDAYRKQRLDMFMAGFGVITLKLKEMYQMITLGGDAELELVDSLDPFAEGIVFSVRPPRKSWKNISNLSGGEKTLSSLALVFALHHYKPTPLYVMDEIDAALDFKNVSIVANYIKERTRNAQFIIISLRNNMFELADRLVGIYKTKDVTKSVTINPKAIAAACAAASEESGETAAQEDAAAPAAAKAATAAVAAPAAAAVPAAPLGDRTNRSKK